MEYHEPGGPVTLLHFSQLEDDYGYGGRRYENPSSAMSAGCSVDTIQQQLQPHPGEAAMPPHSMARELEVSMNCSLPYDYVGTIDSCAVYNSLSVEQTPPAYCGHQHEQMQTAQHPPAPMPPPVGHFDAGFGVHLPPPLPLPDTDITEPPPVRLCLDPPLSIETNSDYHSLSPASTRSSSFYAETSHSHSSPHSPMSVGEQSHRKSYGGISKTYPSAKMSKKSNHRLMLRATSPMFPDQSTPLSSLKRQSSISSITSTRSSAPDQDSVFSFAQSDPSVYSAPNACNSSLNSPSVGRSSPGFDHSYASSCNSPQGSVSASSMDGSSRSCLELEIPAKYARRISDLDKKILKLQADRSKVLEKVHLTKAALSGLIADTRISDMDNWLFSEKLPEMGKAHLYIVPLGIHELDDSLYDDASKLLREVGGMYLDLQTSISILRGICCKGVFIPAEISTCFAYIKSLLHENKNLKLSNLEGVYSIQLDSDEVLSEGVLPAEFTEALDAANQVLKCAQRITLSYVRVQMELLKMRQIAVGKLDTCNATFNKLELMDRERRSQVRAVLEGNCTTMASAERVWPQYYQAATQTIKIITECIHPSSSS